LGKLAVFVQAGIILMNRGPSTVVVALSGGVDSSLAAALLKEAGWKVTGLHFSLPAPPLKKQAKISAVQRIAKHLHITLDVADLEKEFRQSVIGPFTDSYVKGLTPNPCVMCNQMIKFDQLVHYADKKRIQYIATGHYAILITEGDAGVELWRGKDKQKEQSYFLHRLNQSHLSRSLFPLGDLTKKDARRLAGEMGLPSSKEPESQEICFLPENDYRSFIEKEKGSGIIKKGDIIDRHGRILGQHSGAYRFTIGQRHGLGIASSRPYYVTALRPEENEVIVGRKEDLYSTRLEANSFNWIDGSHTEKDRKVMAQIRYRHRAASGLLKVISSEMVRFRFDEPQWAITPGQALVCYDGDRVLGGGWIERLNIDD